MNIRFFNALAIIVFSVHLTGCKSNIPILKNYNTEAFSPAQNFQGKDISIAPHRNDTNSSAFAYQIAGLLTEAGYLVLDEPGTKKNTTISSKKIGDKTVTIKEKSDGNFAKTDFIIESFFSRNSCSLRLLNQETDRIIASSSMTCRKFPSRESSIRTIQTLKLIEPDKAGKLTLYEKQIEQSHIKNPDIPSSLRNKTFTVIPHDFSDIQLEEALIIESDLVSFGFDVDRLPNSIQEIEIKSGIKDGTSTEKYLSWPLIESDYLILSTPVLNYRGYIQNVTLTLIDNETQTVKSVFSGMPNTSLGLATLLEKHH